MESQSRHSSAGGDPPKQSEPSYGDRFILDNNHFVITFALGTLTSQLSGQSTAVLFSSWPLFFATEFSAQVRVGGGFTSTTALTSSSTRFPEPMMTTMSKPINTASTTTNAATTPAAIINASETYLKSFGGLKNQSLISILENPDETLLALGTTTSFGAGGLDIALYKTDENGNLIWSKTFGGKGDDTHVKLERTADAD